MNAAHETRIDPQAPPLQAAWDWKGSARLLLLTLILALVCGLPDSLVAVVRAASALAGF